MGTLANASRTSEPQSGLSDNDYDRRAFLAEASLFLGALSTAYGCKKEPPYANTPAGSNAEDRPDSVRALVGHQRRTLEAAFDRVLPEDQTPGARKAGVIEYADRELARPEFLTLKRNVLAGCVALDHTARQIANTAFVKLPDEQKDEVLKRVQGLSKRGEDFIKFIVLLTLEGFFGDPKYGGNKDGVGWDLSGYGPGVAGGKSYHHWSHKHE